MKKAFRILIIFTVTSVFIYLGAAYAMILFSNVKQPAHEQKSLDFEHIATDGQALPRLDEYEVSDGTRLQYRHYEADTDSVLILLHGSGYHSSYLQPLAEHLSKEGIASVYTPDLRGHGRDTDKRGDIDYIGQIEHNLYDFIELVRGRHPGEAIVLGGHSSRGGLSYVQQVASTLTKPWINICLLHPISTIMHQQTIVGKMDGPMSICHA